MAKKAEEEAYQVDLLTQEWRRWSQTPIWGLVLALLQCAAVVIGLPLLFKPHWEWMVSLADPHIVILIPGVLVHASTILMTNLAMLCVYKPKHPFFEQYRSEPN